MAIADAIYTRLSGFAGLAALVEGRIYPASLPQAPMLPAVVYQRISAERVSSMDGPSGLARPRYQFDAYGDTYDSALDVADQVRLALDGFLGTVAGMTIRGASLDDDRDLYEAETGLHRVSADYLIWHDE